MLQSRCSYIANILVLMYFTGLAIFCKSLCASIALDRAPSDCLYSVPGPDRLFHQSMPSGAPNGAGWPVRQSTGIGPCISDSFVLAMAGVIECFWNVVWISLLENNTGYLILLFREITSVYFWLYEALQNTVTVMLAPFQVWKVLYGYVPVIRYSCK